MTASQHTSRQTRSEAPADFLGPTFPSAACRIRPYLIKGLRPARGPCPRFAAGGAAWGCYRIREGRVGGVVGRCPLGPRP